MSSAQKILEDISSGHWWFTAIAVALLINLLSAYAKPWLDDLLNRMSMRSRATKTKRRQEFEDHVEALASEPYLLLLGQLNELRDRVQLLYFLICSVLALGAAAYFARATDIVAPIRYALVGLAGCGGFLAYLLVFRLLSRSNESARRYEAAIQQLGSRGEA